MTKIILIFICIYLVYLLKRWEMFATRFVVAVIKEINKRVGFNDHSH